MYIDIPKPQLSAMLFKQLESLYFYDAGEKSIITDALATALRRLETCFSRIKNKYYSISGVVRFNPLHGCQYVHFLYLLSNTIYCNSGEVSVCDKIYSLIKMFSSADLYYQVKLPDVFMFDHPLGAVMGRAKYSNYFTFSQGCTVGNNKGIYPHFGESVFMMSNSKVIGNCTIGDNVIIGANSYVKDTDIPSGSLVFGQSPNIIIKENQIHKVREYAESVFIYE